MWLAGAGRCEGREAKQRTSSRPTRLQVKNFLLVSRIEAAVATIWSLVPGTRLVSRKKWMCGLVLVIMKRIRLVISY